MGISKSTFYRDIDESIRKGVVKKITEGYSLNTALFPVFSYQAIEEFKSELDNIAAKDEDFKENRIYKTFYYYYDEGFRDLKVPLTDFPNLL